MSLRRKGLGRGLDALLQPEAEEEGVRSLPVEVLRPNRYQPRTGFDESDLEGLVESIKAQGVVQPLVVALEGDGTYTIIAGERRWRAAKRAGLAEVPVVVREVSEDRELLELALVENLQRSDLNSIEEAEAFQTLRDTFGLSQEEIGARVGKGRSTITNTLRLLKLPREVQDLVREGRLTPGQVRPLLTLPSKTKQLELAQRACKEGLTARALESLASQPRKKGPEKRKPRPVEVHAAAAAEKLTQSLQAKVEIRRRGRGGTVLIHFHSEEELMRIYDFLMKKEGAR